jgi:hypothetical protein
MTALADPEAGLTDSQGAVVEAVQGAFGEIVSEKLPPPAAGVTVAELLERLAAP